MNYLDKNVRTWKKDGTHTNPPHVLTLKFHDQMEFQLGSHADRHVSRIDVDKAENDSQTLYVLEYANFKHKDTVVIKGNFNQLIDIVNALIKNN